MAKFPVAAAVLTLVIVSTPATAQDAARSYTTTDIPFTSHDGHAMLGRLTLPSTPGKHPVLMLVQQAEAMTLDARTRNAKGEPVAVYNVYRDNLAPLNVGFFSYEGRGVHTDSTQPRGQRIENAVYNTSTLDNKVRDAITAVRLLRKQDGVDASQIFLRGISEGTLLAAAVAVRIPTEVKGLVLSGVIGTTLKDMLRYQATDGLFLQHRGHWDADADGRISPQEFETDAKGIRRKSLPDIAFAVFDADRDGSYTVVDRRTLSKPLAAAIDSENIEIIGGWLKVAASVAIPEGWLQDHFRFPSMWDLVSQLTIPIGFFHGENDGNTPAAIVRTLQKQAATAGKKNFEFHYYEGLDHGVGTLQYFTLGKPSPAYAAMFDFIKRNVSPGER